MSEIIMQRVCLTIISLCTLFEITNSRASTMWKLNALTETIRTPDVKRDDIKNYGSLDIEMLLNFNAMAEVYSTDETFFTIVSSTRIDNQRDWLRQSAENSLELLINARKIKFNATRNKLNSFLPFSLSVENKKLELSNNTKNIDSLDCGQPVNYTNYDYLINLEEQYKHKQVQLMPETDVIYFFLHTNEEQNNKNFNAESLKTRLIHLKNQNPLSAELFHQLGNYWRIIGDPVHAIKCFRRSLDITPSGSEVMYDLAKVLYNLKYLDDAIHMARRSIVHQTAASTAWRQYLLLGDIMKTYGDLCSSLRYYRLALELKPKQELILKSPNEAEQMTTGTLHAYTIVIIIVLVIMVLVGILSSMMTEVRADHHNTNGHCSRNPEVYDVKPQRHFNRAMAMRSLKGLSTVRSARQRKY